MELCKGLFWEKSPNRNRHSAKGESSGATAPRPTLTRRYAATSPSGDLCITYRHPRVGGNPGGAKHRSSLTQAPRHPLESRNLLSAGSYAKVSSGRGRLLESSFPRRRESSRRIAPGRGATRPVPFAPRRNVIPAKAGTYGAPRPGASEAPAWAHAGKAERFWRTLNEDLLEGTTFETAEELKEELALYLLYYNTERPHQGLGGKTPLQAL